MRALGIALWINLLGLSMVMAGNVKEHGAVGDGQADDTTAIQRAVSEGGEVIFPSGTYRIDQTIMVSLEKTGYTSLRGQGVAKIVMTGAGPAFRFVGTNEARESLSRTRDQIWERERMPSVDGLSIQGAHAEADGIQADGTVQFTVTRTQIRGARHGIHLVRSNRNVIVSNCHIYANRGIGIFYDDVYVHQSNITGCHISYNLGGGIVSQAGDVRNIHVGTCDLEANLDPEGPPTGNIVLDSRGSVKGVAEVAIVGCTIQHTYKGPGGANIRIVGASAGASETDIRKGNVTIGNNVLSDVQTNIELRNVRGATVTGNTMWRAYRHNLLVESSRDIVIGSNVMGRSPRYSTRGRPMETNAVLLRDCQDVVFHANVLSRTRLSPAGLTVESSTRVNVTGNTIVECDGPEIHFDRVTLSRISDCILADGRKDAPGIKQTNCTAVQLADNLQDP